MIQKLRVPSQKKWIVILFPIALLGSACTKDLIFSDELMSMYNGDEMLNISYQVERTEYREYTDASNPLTISRTVPNSSKERYDLSLNRAGEVKTFLEILSPSENFEVIESLPSSSKEVKYVQYQNGRLKSFDGNRKLIGEAEVPYLKEGYDKLFSSLNEKSKNSDGIHAQLSGGIIWDSSIQSNNTNALNNQVNGRAIAGLENSYDNHEDFKVIRNSYIADNGETYTTELIIHKDSNTLRFMTDYNSSQKAVTRVFFTYENVDGNPELKATHEETLIQDEHSGSAKQIVISNYDFYNINLNL